VFSRQPATPPPPVCSSGGRAARLQERDRVHASLDERVGGRDRSIARREKREATGPFQAVFLASRTTLSHRAELQVIMSFDARAQWKLSNLSDRPDQDSPSRSRVNSLAIQLSSMSET